MTTPRIHCLLSPKEEFSESGAGAQSLKIVQSSRHSRFRESITAFGKPTRSPFPDVAFEPLVPYWPSLFGDKMGLTRAYAKAVRSSRPDLIECFNRPTVAMWLAELKASETKSSDQRPFGPDRSEICAKSPLAAATPANDERFLPVDPVQLLVFTCVTSRLKKQMPPAIAKAAAMSR